MNRLTVKMKTNNKRKGNEYLNEQKGNEQHQATNAKTK